MSLENGKFCKCRQDFSWKHVGPERHQFSKMEQTLVSSIKFLRKIYSYYVSMVGRQYFAVIQQNQAPFVWGPINSTGLY